MLQQAGAELDLSSRAQLIWLRHCSACDPWRRLLIPIPFKARQAVLPLGP